MKPIFVIGHPKSGTSLMNSLLDNHPDMVTLSEESDFYLRIWPKAERLNAKVLFSGEKRANMLYNAIITRTHFSNYLRGRVEKDISGNLDYIDFPKDEFLALLRDSIEKSMNNELFKRRELLDAIVSAYGTIVNAESWKSKKYWVEKTPKHTWHLNEVLEDYPNASFVFVHRDPRDNYVSFKKKLGDALTIPKFCKTWNDAIHRFDQIPSHVPKIMVSYETLIRNQKDEIERIAAFLDIAVGPTLLTPTKLGKAWKGNSMFDLASAEMHDKSIGRFEKTLSEVDIRALEYFTSENMHRLGYALRTNASPDDINNIDSLKAEYNNYYPFNIGAPLTMRSKLGLLRRRLIG